MLSEKEAIAPSRNALEDAMTEHTRELKPRGYKTFRVEIRNYDCEGAHCQLRDGEVRVLPCGGGANMVLCCDCFDHEIRYRRERNRFLGDFAKFKLPSWESLEVYDPT